MKQFLAQLLTSLKKTIFRMFSFPYSVTALIVGFFSLIFFLFVEVNGFGFRRAAFKMVNDIGEADKIRDSLIYKYATANKCTEVLSNQYLYMDRYKKHHLETARLFEVYYYAFVLILILAAVITGIMGVLIGRTGWQNQTPAIRAAFLGFFFTASFSGVCMNVFNNAQNANKNITQYFYFTNLQTNIYDAMAVPDDSLDKRCEDGALREVFSNNNKNMKDNMSFFLDINADKIPTTDISSMDKTVNGPTNK